MGYVPWAKLEYKKRPGRRNARRYRADREVSWTGIDTETCRGNVRLLADSTGRKVWDPTLKEALDFLYLWGRPEWADSHNRNIVNGVFFNLRYDIECILKQLPPEQISRILKDNEASAEGYSLKWIPRKRFSLKPGKWGNNRVPVSHHYDIAQFFGPTQATSPDGEVVRGLDACGVRYLGKGKEGLPKKTVQLLGRSRKAWDQVPKRDIERYCIRDATLTKELSELWWQWAEASNLDFKNPISPAYVAGEYAQVRGWPYWSSDVHHSVGEIAYGAYSGGRFESRVKGYGDYWSADLISAYPAEMVNLPNPDVVWLRRDREREAVSYPWGFVQARVRVNPDAEWGPLAVRSKRGVLHYPTGNLGYRWITLLEYLAFKDSPDIKMNFVKGWVAEDDGTRPLSWISELFDERRVLKANDDPRQLVLKVMMNSIYGKTIQKTAKSWRLREAMPGDQILHRDSFTDEDGVVWIREEREWEIGPLFNPIWAAHITAGTRVKLWEMTQRYDVAAVATDGILTREPIPASEYGSRLGAWENGGMKPGVIVGNGLYQREGEKPKRRGFGEPLGGFAWLDALRKAGRNATTVRVVQERPLHPGEIMNSRKWKISDIGRFEKEARVIQLNDDEKRSFPRVTAGKLLREQFVGTPHLVS